MSKNAKSTDINGFNIKTTYFGLHMLILDHETLYGEQKGQVSTYEQAWESMSRHTKSTDSNGFNMKIPYYGPPHAE